MACSAASADTWDGWAATETDQPAAASMNALAIAMNA
jgi:hypothetical protein